MVAIVIGYKQTGNAAPFEILYSGRDATAADQLSLNPPAGIVRTEMFKNPIVVRRRTYPENVAPIEEAPAKAPKPAKPKEPALAPDLLPESND